MNVQPIGQAGLPRPRGARSAPNASTWHLCAGAYLDQLFARRVLEEYRSDGLRAVAPSYSVDAQLVVDHCEQAEWLRLLRDLAICSVLFAWLLVNPWALLVVVSSLWSLHMFRLLRRVEQRREQRTWLERALGQTPAWIRALLRVWFWSTPFGVGLWLVSGLLSLVPLASFLALGTGVFGVSGLEGLFRTQLSSTLLLVLLWLSVTTYLLVTWASLVNQVTGDQGATPRPAQPANNVTVYSGRTYYPFVGAGEHVRTWAFALELLPVAGRFSFEGQPDCQVTIPELNQRVAERLQALGDPTLPAVERLHGIWVEDRVFAEGIRLFGDEVLLPDPERAPNLRVSPEHVRAVMERPIGAVRHCLAVHVTSWSGEVVVSVFLHFATDGKMLYLESSSFVLPPVRQSYQVVDGLLPRLGVAEVGRAMAQAGYLLGTRVIRAPFGVFGVLRAHLWRSRSSVRAIARIRASLGYDYGATAGVREMAAASDFDNYFQELDAGKYLKIIQRRIFQAVLEFLEEQGVDTTEYRRQQNEITNNGVVITGGTVHGSVAGGLFAQAASQSTSRPSAPGGHHAAPAQ